MKKSTRRTISIITVLALLISTFAMGVVPATAEGNLSGHTCSDTPFEDKVVELYVPATCAKAGYYRYTCSGCGESDFVTIPALNHTGFEHTTVITKMPTCTEQGEKVEFCQGCGLIVKSSKIAATGHDSGVWKIDYEATADHNGSMTKYCTKCGEALESKEIELHEHVEGYKETIRQATCTEDGLSGTICSVCGACYETASIPAKGHSEADSAVWVTSVPAGCITKGEATGYCADCGTIVGTKEIAEAGHVEGTWMTTKAASCCDKGCKSEICTRCGETIATKEIAALGHDDGVWTVAIDPTCTDAGEEHLTCTRCGGTIDSREIEALGHDDGVWKVDFEPTPEYDGQMTRYCTRCNEKLESKTFKKHVHTKGYEEVVIPATCMKKGEMGIFCATCGAQYDSYLIDATGHNYGDWYMNLDGTHSRTCDKCLDVETNNCEFEETVTEPTCIDFGYTTHTCKVCGFYYKDTLVEPLGHDWGEWITDDDFTHTRTCQRCGDTETDIHCWSEWEFNHDNTFFKQGTKTRYCFDCGLTQTETAHHTSTLCQIFYPVINWFLNIFHKIQFVLSLDWLFPCITIYPEY